MAALCTFGATHAADSTCFPFPLPYSLRLQFSPQPTEDSSVGCAAPLPCYAATPPTLMEWPENLTQELKLTAQAADAVEGYKYLEIWQQDWNPVSGSWNAGTVFESSDAIERADQGNDVATYGISGLETGVRYRFRVAWCRLTGSVRTCNCFPDTAAILDEDADGTADARPTTFPSPPLAAPSGLTARAEDRFRRPATDPKRDRATNGQLGGDGLGPTAWHDDMGSPQIVNIGNGAHIVVDGAGNSFAEVPWNSFLEYQVSTSPIGPPAETHTVAEVEYRPRSTAAQPNGGPGSLCPGQVACNHRVSAVSRMIGVAPNNSYYNVQVSYDPDWPGGGDTEPKVRVQRGMHTNRADVGSAFTVSGTAAFNPETGLGCVIDGSPAAADDDNIAGLKDDSRKLVRARVRDRANGLPEIFATVAWDWDGATYDSYCVWRRNDDDINGEHPLFKKAGGWALIVQHYDAAVEAFRTFSAPPQ